MLGFVAIFCEQIPLHCWTVSSLLGAEDNAVHILQNTCKTQTNKLIGTDKTSTVHTYRTSMSSGFDVCSGTHISELHTHMDVRKLMQQSSWLPVLDILLYCSVIAWMITDVEAIYITQHWKPKNCIWCTWIKILFSYISDKLSRGVNIGCGT